MSLLKHRECEGRAERIKREFPPYKGYRENVHYTMSKYIRNTRNSSLIPAGLSLRYLNFLNIAIPIPIIEKEALQ
jgi:hypothetical protein